MAASMKTSRATPNRVIFKKTSRDKSVSGTEMSSLMEIIVFVKKGAFSRIDTINTKTQ